MNHHTVGQANALLRATLWRERVNNHLEDEHKARQAWYYLACCVTLDSFVSVKCDVGLKWGKHRL